VTSPTGQAAEQQASRERDLVIAERDRPPEGIEPRKYEAAIDYAARRYAIGLKRYERVIERIGLSGAASVLDVGSGAGHWCIALARHNGAVTGIELRDEYVEIARRMAQHLEVGDRTTYVTGSAEDASFRPAAFQGVCCHSVLMFVDHESVLANIARWTAPNGLFYCGYTTVGARLAEAVRAIGREDDARAQAQLGTRISDGLMRCGVNRQGGRRVRAFRRDELLAMCDAFGFTFVESPDVQDGPRTFLGEPSTFDFVCRRRAEDPLERLVSVEPGERVQLLRSVIAAGCPRLALSAIATVDPDTNDPEVVEVYLRALLKRGEPVEGGWEGELLRSLAPHTRQLLTGISRHVGGALEGALESYRSVPVEDPDRAFLIGACLISLGRHDEARAAVCGRGFDPGHAFRDWALATSAVISSQGAAAARPLAQALVTHMRDSGEGLADEAGRFLAQLHGGNPSG
jgi:2-polyprenyl-3-methyl-5-hydroxy-6-metoxy-1,4-benzoquinol methylase